MKVTDAIFALIAGRIISFLLGDFLQEWDVIIPLYESLLLWLVIPLFALFCLWIAYLIGRKLLFIYQAAKHFLVGAVVTVVDLKVFEFLIWLLSTVVTVNPLASKAISFFIATLLKYLGNKYWAFQRHGRENLRKEVAQFFYITLFSLLVDIGMFHYFINITGPQFGLSVPIWIKLSVIFASLGAAVFNFLGYKFIVFKK